MVSRQDRTTESIDDDAITDPYRVGASKTLPLIDLNCTVFHNVRITNFQVLIVQVLLSTERSWQMMNS